VSSPTPLHTRINSYMQRTNSRVTEHCMRDLGFKYVYFVEPYQGPPIVPIGEPLRGRDSYSLISVAKSWATPSKNPNFSIREALNSTDREAYDAALNGVNRKTQTAARAPAPESCAGKGTASSYEVERKIAASSSQARARFDQQLEVIEYRKAWRDCMKGFGYQHATRTDLVLGLLSENPDLNELEAAEAEAVKHDHQCVTESDETAFQRRAQEALQAIDTSFLDR
jgi:hypothetical protein